MCNLIQHLPDLGTREYVSLILIGTAKPHPGLTHDLVFVTVRTLACYDRKLCEIDCWVSGQLDGGGIRHGEGQ